MRVACIIHSLDGGGAERVMASLCSRLARRGHEVTLVTLDDGSRERHQVDSAVTRRRLGVMKSSHGWRQRLVHMWERHRSLRATIAEVAPEVVLSFCDRTNIQTLFAVADGIPVVVSERSDPAQQHLGRFWERLRDLSYRRAAAIVALTEVSADHLRTRFRVPVVVIASAVDSPPFVSDRVQAIETKRILGVGRLEYEKGFDRLIDAFSQLPPSCRDWSLRVIGEGSRRGDLERQVERLGLRDRVTLPGWVQPVWDEFAAATMFALPSRYEGFPSALMEAMAMGVPSVAVDCESGPRAVIREPGWGLLVPDETKALAAGLLQLIERSDYREQLGESGKQVLQHFDWDRLTDAYERLLHQVITPGSVANGPCA